MSAWFEGTISYDVCEIGIWSGSPDDPDSVLFAYWSQENGNVAVMSSGVDFVFTHDMTLDSSVGEALNIVIDPDASTALILMASHEANPNPHPQYALKTELAESWEEHLSASNPHSQYVTSPMLASAIEALENVVPAIAAHAAMPASGRSIDVAIPGPNQSVIATKLFGGGDMFMPVKKDDVLNISWDQSKQLSDIKLVFAFATGA